MSETISDLVGHALGERPIDFENTFSTLINNKIGVAIDAKKHEVAQKMFAPAEPEDTGENQEDG